MENLRWAHGRAAHIRRQQTLFEVGEKHGIDQLSLAPRELREKSQHHAIIAQAFHQIMNTQTALDVGVTVGIQPALISLNSRAQVVAPLLIRGYLKIKILGHLCTNCFGKIGTRMRSGR